jgi:hypothetical protein
MPNASRYRPARDGLGGGAAGIPYGISLIDVLDRT